MWLSILNSLLWIAGIYLAIGCVVGVFMLVISRPIEWNRDNLKLTASFVFLWPMWVFVAAVFWFSSR